MAVPRQPVGGAVAVAQPARRIAVRQELVDVMEQGGRLHEPAIERRPAGEITRSASQPATSATARAWRSAQGAGSRERRRAAASTRPGTVIDPMVQAGDGPGVRVPGRPDVRAIEARRGVRGVAARFGAPSGAAGRGRTARDGPPGSGMPQR